MAAEAKSLAGMPRLTPKPTSPPIPGESVTCETLEEAQEYCFLPDAFKRNKHPLVRRSNLQGILLVLCPSGRRCCEMLGRRHHFPLSSRAYLQIHDRVAGLNIAVPFNFPWDDEHMGVQGKCGSGSLAPKVSHNSIHGGPRPVHCSQALLTPQRACQFVHVMYQSQK